VLGCCGSPGVLGWLSGLNRLFEFHSCVAACFEAFFLGLVFEFLFELGFDLYSEEIIECHCISLNIVVCLRGFSLSVIVFLNLLEKLFVMSSEYRTHSFKKEWHDKVEEFLEENDDLAFDSPKYFIKFCVNKYMDDKSNSISERELDKLKDKLQSLNKEFDE
jgi:hypothetical protein